MGGKMTLRMRAASCREEAWAIWEEHLGVLGAQSIESRKGSSALARPLRRACE